MNRHISKHVTAAALVALGLLAAGAATPARADGGWTLNIGYQNPVVSTWGLNLLYIGSSWGFEAGLGWVDLQNHNTTDQNGKTTTNTSFHAAGDVNLKYFLSDGSLRPYLQAGVAVGLGADNNGAGAGAGDGFGGIGLLLGSAKLYAYGSYNINVAHYTFAQAGIGFGL